MKLQNVRAKLPKSIKRITILKPSPAKSDEEAGRVVVKRKRKRKQQSKGLARIWERVVRQAARASRSTAESYLSRHQSSNRKRRDGWLRDYSYNWSRASRKGAKKFKLAKIFD